MRVLFIGADWYGSNARSMATGFVDAGHEVRIVDIAHTLHPPISERVSRKVFGRSSPRSSRGAEQVIRSIAGVWKPDMLFCFKTVDLDQEALLRCGTRWAVHYSPDDVLNPENTSLEYLRFEAEWDLVVTTKAYNVAEIEMRSPGARAKFVWSAYDPRWHFPSYPRNAEATVGFIGTARSDRVPTMINLSGKYGKDLRIHGPRWLRASRGALARADLRPGAFGEDFSAAVAGIRSNLVLLNSANRDTHTCRSFEVPAARGLFVGERTPEHQAMLEEEKECYLFSSLEELSDVLATIARLPESAVRRTAGRGFERITGGCNTYAYRARQIVSALTDDA